MNSKGLSVLQDIFSGGVGALAGVAIAGPILRMARHGTDARAINYPAMVVIASIVLWLES